MQKAELESCTHCMEQRSYHSRVLHSRHGGGALYAVGWECAFMQLVGKVIGFWRAFLVGDLTSMD